MNATVIKGNWNDKSEEVYEAQNKPFIFINSNGSRWMGEEPGDITELLEALTSYKLREDYHYISVNPCRGVINPEWRYESAEPHYIDGDRLFNAENVYCFSGNFDDYSHVFSIYTNDPETIEKLTSAIRKNPGYKAA